MLFQGDFVHTPKLGQLEILHDHILRVNKEGNIAFLAPSSSPEALTLIQTCVAGGDAITQITPGSFLLPAYTDLHIHAPQFLYQGTGLHLPLMQWLELYAFRAEERIDADPALAERVYRQLARRLCEAGAGCVLAFGTIKVESNIILAKCLLEAGIRAFVGKLSMDISSRPSYVESSAHAALASFETFASSLADLQSSLASHRRLVEPVITPRFAPTCSDELLEGLGKLAKEKGWRVQSHLAESVDEVEWVRAERKCEDIDVFEKHGLLTPRTVQAHCTFLPPSSLAHLAERGTAIAHCPLSNAYFSARSLRLREALDRGVKVGLGSDVAGGYELGIEGAMKSAAMMSRMREGGRIMSVLEGKDGGDPVGRLESGWGGRQVEVVEGRDEPVSVDWKEALYLATKGGAEALDYASGAGSFTVGAPFDAQWIRLVNDKGQGIGALDFLDGCYAGPMEGGEGWTLNEMNLERWWCLGDVRNRVSMWVQGKRVYSSVD